MPYDISTDAIIEKNKITSEHTWLLLLKITYGVEDIGHICLNNESVSWDGKTWLPAIFSLTGLSETKDAEIPSVTLTIDDFQRNLIPTLEESGGGVGTVVTLYVVHSNHLDNLTPELEEEMEIISVTIDARSKVVFTLGSENLSTLRCPQQRYLKNHCRFVFKSSRCGYSGIETSCNRTFARCKELNNETRYGGFPGIGTSGIQV